MKKYLALFTLIGLGFVALGLQENCNQESCQKVIVLIPGEVSETICQCK